MLLLQGLLRVTEGGLVWLGVPCQSWVCLSRSYTSRSSVQPQGPPPPFAGQRQREYLARHNKIAERVALVLQTCTLLRLQWVIGQPLSPLRLSYKAIAQEVRKVGVVSVCIRMDNLRGDSPKPLLLKGTARFLATLQEVSKLLSGLAAPQRLVVEWTSAQGVKQFTGKKKALKKSSAYTFAFGAAVALAFRGLDAVSIHRGLRAQGY